MTTPDEIDDLARGLPPFVPEPARAESVRTAALLAAASTSARPVPARKVRIAIAVALPLAAAAGSIWYLGRGENTAVSPSAELEPATPGAPVARRIVIPQPGARYQRSLSGEEERVQLEEGGLEVEVANLPPAGRVLVAAADAEVTAREARFDVEARASRLVAVRVVTGKVEFRASREAALVILSAGVSWAAPETAVDAGVTGGAAASPEAAERPRHRTQAEPARGRKEPNEGKAALQDGAAPPVAVAPTAPGEAEFRAAWAALRGGDARRAAELFADARRAGGRSDLAEDAHFWEGMALARSGQSGRAIRELETFLVKHPSYSRAGEAAARLGWLLYDAGRIDQAESWFKAAQNDRVPKVKKSARDGLEAIRRRRTP